MATTDAWFARNAARFRDGIEALLRAWSSRDSAAKPRAVATAFAADLATLYFAADGFRPGHEQAYQNVREASGRADRFAAAGSIVAFLQAQLALIDGDAEDPHR